jgi:hypothetical protein
MPRRAPRKTARARRAHPEPQRNPLTRPLTLKWIAGLAAAGVTALVMFQQAGNAWDYLGGPHFATREWTTQLYGKLSSKLEGVAATTNVLGLQNRLVTLQGNKDAGLRERSSIEFQMKTVKDPAALDFMKRRLDTVQADIDHVAKQLEQVASQIDAAQNPPGNKRARGGGYDEKTSE